MKFKRRIKNLLISLLAEKPKHVTANIIQLAPNELLKGRTALITGGTSGIGFSIATAFINAGATVVITGRNEKRVYESCCRLDNETKTHGRAFGIAMDITDVIKIKSIFEKILTIVPSNNIDILVNNAGVIGKSGISTISEVDFDSVLETNLKGPFFLSSVVGAYMRDNKIEGNILNIASSSSLRPANSAYGISKWGMRGFTLGLAKSLLPYNIVVNGLAPGPTATPMIQSDSSKGIGRNGLLGRMIMPEEMANMAVIMVSGIGRTIIGDIVYQTTGCGVLTYDDISCKF